MTEEQLEYATKINHDIYMLEKMKICREIKKWIGISTSTGALKDTSFRSDYMKEQFDKFIAEKLAETESN